MSKNITAKYWSVSMLRPLLPRLRERKYNPTGNLYRLSTTIEALERTPSNERVLSCLNRRSVQSALLPFCYIKVVCLLTLMNPSHG